MTNRRAFLKTAALAAAIAPTSLLSPSSGQAAALSLLTNGGSNNHRRRSNGPGGFSGEGLERMHDVLAGHVARRELPGLVTLVSRGSETHADAIGMHAFGSQTPMRRDTIFRVASLTKPVTAVAAMILVEEGKLRLDDPVDPLLPELANRNVLRSLESPLTDVVPANRSITLRDLLTMRLGVGAIMVFPERHPIQKAMSERGLAPSAELPSVSYDEYMKRLGSLPLVYQPGERWMYNTGSDVLGILIARATGRSLGVYLRERIFEPLGMKDTGFSVPAAKLDRLPTMYFRDPATQRFVTLDEPRGGKFSRPPVFESGAGGLVSTVDDFLTFGRMMLSKGALGRVRILSRLSVETMTTDQITDEQKRRSAFFPDFWDNTGWGLGLAVITKRDGVASVPGRFGWDGGYGTSWYSDPRENLVGILMTQRVWDSPIAPAVQRDFWTTTYAAIED